LPDKSDPSPKDKAEDIDSFFIKMPDLPLVSSAEAAATEKDLLSRYKSRGPRSETLKPLALFYSRVAQHEKAYQYLKVWMKYARNKNELAECLLMCGQLAEQIDQPGSAVSFYQEGLKHGSEDYKVNYYLHNNLAYCLNQQAEYEAAMNHCERAIAIDSTRANAFKNLGLSLEAQGRYGEAAKTWIKAVHVDASDTRSLELLEKLTADHYDAVKAILPDIDTQREACRRAVSTAKIGRFADWARGLTLN
jgi:tetratricopeptide (TPR) repeat protein